MGVSYVVLALNEETADWLRNSNCQLPSELTDSRFPSLVELKAAVEGLENYRASFRLSRATNSVDIEIVDQGGYWAGWSTTIWASRLNDKTRPPDDDDTVRFTFHKGSPELAILIVERLAGFCGPLILVRDIDCKPLLVTDGLSRQSVDAWLND